MSELRSLFEDAAQEQAPQIVTAPEVVHFQRQSATRPLAHRLICGADMRSCGDAWVTAASDERDAVNCPRCLAILDREGRAA